METHLRYLSFCFLSSMLFQLLTDLMVSIKLSNIKSSQAILKIKVKAYKFISNIQTYHNYELASDLVLKIDLSTFGN